MKSKNPETEWRCLNKDKIDLGWVAGKDENDAKVNLRINESWPTVFEDRVYYLVKTTTGQKIQVRDDNNNEVTS